MDKFNKFSNIVKQLRKENELTMQEFAEKIGFSKGAVNDWENRGTEPNIETIIKIAKFFNVSVDYLIGIED